MVTCVGDVEIVAEQSYLDHAYDCLDAMQRRTADAAADAAERAPGDWDASVAHAHLTRRLGTLGADGAPLCFGRVDEERGRAWHVGRRHVEDPAGEPVVVDWRADVAVPFYRATFRDPLGLSRRRRFILQGRELVDLLDEDFSDPDSAVHAAGAGLPDPLLAELGRARTGAMRDIVATIAAEQDVVIRAPLDMPLVVQGGPGTGKTAVGLHRAAFLLYEHRDTLERRGVLVLGPNRIFLAYISEVLPSLGEVAVVQTTLAGLVPQWAARAEDPPEVAALKGDGRMARVVARACRAAVTAPKEDLVVATRWGSVRLTPDETALIVERALESGSSIGQRRSRFRRAVARHVTRILTDRRPDAAVDIDGVLADLRADRAAQRQLDRIWPAQSPPAVIRAVLGREAVLAGAAHGALSAPEQRLLHRRPARSVAAEAWTPADLALLDEADAELNGAPRQYGHIVVDEAQDLSAMALRMVARRSADGRSLTVLGDLAQATAPGAVTAWDTALACLGRPPGARVLELSTGYRVPRPIMDLANRVLETLAPGLPPTVSVRPSGDDPVARMVEPGRLVEAVASEAHRLTATLLSVAVIAGDARDELTAALRDAGLAVSAPGAAHDAAHVSVIAPHEAKGLEFDGVVLVEPGAILEGPAGPGLVYICLTRAVQHLSMVHSRPLPGVLRPGVVG